MDSGQLEVVGGMAGLVEYDGVPGVNLDGYVRILLDKSARRRAMIMLNAAMLRLSGCDDCAETLAWVQQGATEAAEKLSLDSGFRSVERIIQDAGGLDAFLSGGSANVVPVPWGQLSNLLTRNGLRGGQQIVLAGPPGKGKTAMALALAKHAGRQTGKSTAIISLEMGGEEITERSLAAAAGINTRDLARAARNGNVERIRTAASKIIREGLLISDCSIQTLSAIRGRLMRLAAKEPLCLVIVDYLQLIETSGRKDNRATALGEISRGLKLLAKELDIPIVALSQLNRESRKEEREPELHDLRESGNIEQDADIVLMIHFVRPYDIAAGIYEGELKLLVRKQRNGAEGAIRLFFHAPTGTFREPDGEID